MSDFEKAIGVISEKLRNYGERIIRGGEKLIRSLKL